MNVGFRITNKFNIRNASKLLFTLMSDSRESIIAFLYSFDLFEYLFIKLISYNSFQNDDNKSLEIIVNVDPKSMQITIFSNKSPNTVI